MRRTAFICTFVLLVAACGNNKQQEESIVTDSLQGEQIDTIPEAPFTQLGDTLTIAGKAAVAYQPDSLQVEKRKAALGEEDFYIGADDFLFYLNTSYNYLRRQGLPVMDATGKKYLQFITADKKGHLLKLDTLADLWGIFLFDGTKAPRQVDLTAIEAEYKNYYQ